MGRKPKDTIYVGTGKEVMSYVTAAIRTFKDCGRVCILARGRAISAAVDVAEILRHKFIDADVDSIDINTEVLEDKKRISAISIVLVPQ